jgi:hypothetical protein
MNMHYAFVIGLLLAALTCLTGWIRPAKLKAVSVLALLLVLAQAWLPSTALATTVSKTFTTHSIAGAALLVHGGETFTYSVSGTFVGVVKLQRSRDASTWTSFLVIPSSFTTTPALTGTITVDGSGDRREYFRVYCSTHSSGSIVTALADVNDLVQDFRNKRGGIILQLYDDGIVVPGTLSVTGASTLTGAVAGSAAFTTTAGGFAASSGTSAGATPFKLKGAYTSTQIGTLSASAGEVIYNTTTASLCNSTAPLSGAQLGAWVYPSTTSTPSVRAICY